MMTMYYDCLWGWCMLRILGNDVWWRYKTMMYIEGLCWCVVMVYNDDVYRGSWWWCMTWIYDDNVWGGCMILMYGDGLCWWCMMRMFMKLCIDTVYYEDVKWGPIIRRWGQDMMMMMMYGEGIWQWCTIMVYDYDARGGPTMAMYDDEL